MASWSALAMSGFGSWPLDWSCSGWEMIWSAPESAALRNEVTAITDAAQSALDKAKSDPSLLTDQGGGQNDPFTEANKLANAYGLDQCGSNN